MTAFYLFICNGIYDISFVTIGKRSTS